MASYLKTKNRIQAQVRLRGVKIFKTFADKKSARAWAINKETEIKRPEILNEKFYDDDVEKGLGALLGIDKKFRK